LRQLFIPAARHNQAMVAFRLACETDRAMPGLPGRQADLRAYNLNGEL
jgi:hypothetical protein